MEATHRQRLELYRLGLLLGRAWPEVTAYACELSGDPDLSGERATQEIGKLRRRAERCGIPVQGLADDADDPWMPGDDFPPPPKAGYAY